MLSSAALAHVIQDQMYFAFRDNLLHPLVYQVVNVLVIPVFLNWNLEA